MSLKQKIIMYASNKLILSLMSACFIIAYQDVKAEELKNEFDLNFRYRLETVAQDG